MSKAKMITISYSLWKSLRAAADYHIPHKPNWDSDGYADGHEVWDAHCPKCGAEIDECDNFCPACGQSIDWSEDEKADD